MSFRCSHSHRTRGVSLSLIHILNETVEGGSRNSKINIFKQLALMMEVMNNIKSEINASNIEPVSYTHLDVYKRQVQ